MSVSSLTSSTTDRRTGSRARVVLALLTSCLVAAVLLGSMSLLYRVAPASAAGTFTLQNQGPCTGWGNVILAGSSYAPGVPNAPNVYGNLYGRSCANGYINGTSPYGYQHQCTEFAVHWAASVWGVNPTSWKSGGQFVDAQQMWPRAAAIAGLVRVPNGSGAPQPGDLMVFQDTSVGHVAVVAGVSGTSLYFVGQNQSEAEQHITISNGNYVTPSVASRWLGVSGSVLGWIRAHTVSSLHTSVALIPRDGSSGYTLDGYGQFHPFGNAPAITSGIGGWPGWDIARSIAISPNSTPQAVTGYVLDGYGGIHPFAAGGVGPPPAPVNGAYWRGWDIARALVLSSPTTGYVLDGYGGFHPFSPAGVTAPAAPANAPYWPYWDIARALVLSSPTTGYVLDGYGGVHPFSPAGVSAPPAPVNYAYWSGWDIARGIALISANAGFVLDGYGGVHPFSPAGVAPPASQSPGYTAGNDVFKGIAADRTTRNVVDVRAYNSDGSGGAVYSFATP